MITIKGDNITTKATKYKAQKHKSINTEIQWLKKNKIKQNKNTKISSAVQYNENTVLDVSV